MTVTVESQVVGTVSGSKSLKELSQRGPHGKNSPAVQTRPLPAAPVGATRPGGGS